MLEMSSILAGFTLEASQGPQTGAALDRAITTGDVPMRIEALTQSYSILSSLVAAHVRLPADKKVHAAIYLAFASSWQQAWLDHSNGSIPGTW